MTFYDLITNEVLIIPFCSWFAAQFIKLVLVLIRERRFDLRIFVSSGGMPSAHSALVGALATTVAMTEGLGSVAFGITAILAMIVMYDAAGVRQSVGQQAAVLNRIIDEMRFRRVTELERDLRELIGHTHFQVYIGLFVGILIAWLWLTLIG